MVFKALLSTIEFKIPPDWAYRGEGNANIVISLPKNHQILRIRKEEKPKTILGWFMDWLSQLLKWDSINEMNKELRDLKFYTLVMRRLLGEKFVCPAKPVHISRKQIKNLDEKLTKFRPESRKNKRLQYGRATLFQDYAFLPNERTFFTSANATFSVEIKPKQGWVPFSQRNVPNCPYCLNQYLKLETGQIKKISSYCPLDLFSGDEERMLKAIRSLIENPQNNFRIFRNGDYVYGENCPVQDFSSLVEEWFFCKTVDELLIQECCRLIVNTLLKQFQSVLGCDRCENTHCEEMTVITYCTDSDLCKKCDYSGNKLPLGCLLERIISVQMLDNEGPRIPARKIDSWDYVEKLLTEICYNTNRCLNCVIKDLKYKCEGSSQEDLAFVPYMIAAVARDCSLMLTFKKVDDCDIIAPEGLDYLSTKFGTFCVNAGIFDLYPKPMSVLEKHKKRNEKMRETLTRRTWCS